jgi:hypothetical protein
LTSKKQNKKMATKMSKIKAPLTPSQKEKKTAGKKKEQLSAKKQIVFEDAPETNEVEKVPTTPHKSEHAQAAEKDVPTPVKVKSATKSAATKELSFGYSSANRTVTEPEVKSMYKIVNKCTGSLGGNGSGGAIYGELTQASMQKVVNLLVEKGGLNKESAFIDVGAGLGKPNLHVAIDPGVKVSVGIEMEYVRWLLSLHNLHHFLDETENIYKKSEKNFLNNVIFMHGDAMQAKSFDPFTHIYMFDIGFPPALFLHLAECVRKSSSAKYVLCYHAPHLMIERYGFDMEFVEKQATSMHGM